MKKILIAEDYEPLTELYNIWLEDAGYEVINAKNGQEAVDKYAMHEPDLVIMDIKMPEKEGDVAIMDILNQDPQARIIAVTAYPFESTELQGVEVLKKGFRRDKFMEVVERKLAMVKA